jgi:putative ABC transport system permease protein
MVIVIGLMSYIALSMAMNNLDVTVESYYNMTNFADGYIDFTKISSSNIEKIGEIDGIDSIEGRIVGEVQLDIEDENVRIRVISEPSEEGINQLFFDASRETLETDREIFMVDQFAKARGYQIGDEIKLIISGRRYTMILKEIIDSPEFVYMLQSEQILLPDSKKFGVIYVTKDFAQSAFDMGSLNNQAIFTIDGDADIERIMDEIDEEFSNLGITHLTEKKNQLSNRMLNEEIESGRKTVLYIPIFFIGVAAIIMVFMINRMVKNDRTMIGILKAMGYTNLNIMSHYAKLTVLIGLVGSVVGITLGFQISGWMAQFYVDSFFNIPMLEKVFYPWFALNAILITTSFTVAAGILGSRKILLIHPAESMRPAPPRIGKKIFLERYDRIWSRIRFDWKSVIRSAMRNKRRLMFTLMGIAMTYSLTLIPITLMDSFEDLFISQFEEFQQMDYTIAFKTFVSEDDLHEISKITKATKAEGKLEIPFEIEQGSKNKIVSMIGIQENTEMYNLVNVDGEVIQIPEDGVLITESVSNYFGYQKGDRIELKTFIPGHDDQIVVVKDVIEQTLGINLYANLEYMQNELVEKGAVNSILIDSDEDVKGILEDYAIIASVQSIKDIRDTFMEFMDLTIYSVTVILVFAAILGFAIVYNSGIMTISERQLEFSSMRVMGFNKYEIFKMITRETLVIAVLGILVGMPMGQAMMSSLYSSFNNDLYTFKFIVTPQSHLKTALMTTVFVAVSVFATYEKIHRLNFIDALKNRMT